MRYDGVSSLLRTFVYHSDAQTASERDPQLLWRLADVLDKKQHTVQIGDNTNLVDYCYVGNVAAAHVLAIDRLLAQPETINGEVFFITNGEPVPTWDFSRKIWKELGDDGKGKIIKIPRSLGLVLAFISETFAKITGSSTQFTRFSIHFLTSTQWYNIDKVCNPPSYTHSRLTGSPCYCRQRGC